MIASADEKGGGGQPVSGKGRCPECGKPVSQEYKPFCSQRCANIDLNRWLTGAYAIPVVEEDKSAGNEEDEEG